MALNDQLIAGLAKSLELDEIPKNDDGHWFVSFDDLPTIELLQLAGTTLLVRVQVATLPAEGRERQDAISNQLKLNMSQLKHQPETLGLDKTTGAVLLYRTLKSNEIDQPQFNQQIEQFVNTLEWWQQALSGAAASNTSPMSLAQMSPMNFLRP